MTEFVLDALGAIPAVASSPYALVAYVVLVVAWAVIAWRVRRNKHLLAALKNLPEEDRLKAIELEMGAVRLRSGLSPEQWLRSQIHRYLLVGFAVACLTAVLIVALSLHLALRQWEPEISLTMADVYSVRGVDEQDKARYEALSQKTDYIFEQRDGVMHVAPAGYLHHLREGAIVPEVQPDGLGEEYPALSYKIANNTDHTLLLSELVLDVHSSTLDEEPVLVVQGNRHGELIFRNVGWGGASEPVLDIGIVPDYVCSGAYYQMGSIENRPLRREMMLQGLPTIVDISEFVSEIVDIEPMCDEHVDRVCDLWNCEYIEFKEIRCLDEESYRRCDRVDRPLSIQELEALFPGAPAERRFSRTRYHRSCYYSSVCVFGVLSYTPADPGRAQFKFYADVQFEPRPRAVDRGPGRPTPPTRIYDAVLEAGRSGYAVRLPIAHTLRPGESDHFVVNLRSNHSAEFDLTMSVISAGGDEVHQQRVNLAMYVPPVYRPGDMIFRRESKDAELGRLITEDLMDNPGGGRLGDMLSQPPEDGRPDGGGYRDGQSN